MENVKELPENFTMKKYWGYKFYKSNEDGSFEVLRVIDVDDKDPLKCKVLNLDTNTSKKVSYEYLQQYVPLQPYGIVSFNIVALDWDYKNNKPNNKDVMILAYKALDIKMGMNDPYIVCRQSVNDFFAQLMDNDPENEFGQSNGMGSMYGVCVSRDTCPTNIKMKSLTACVDIIESQIVNVYRDDDVKSILKCLNVATKYNIDATLNSLKEKHLKTVKNPMLKYGKVCEGWCPDVDTLLDINNFMADFNSMCEVTGFDFDLEKWMDKDDRGIYHLQYPVQLFFNNVFKVNAKETRIMKFSYQINLGDFNNTNYVIIRDNTNTLWLVVYIVEGEYLEEELLAEMNKLSVTDKLRLSYYNKYK